LSRVIKLGEVVGSTLSLAGSGLTDFVDHTDLLVAETKRVLDLLKKRLGEIQLSQLVDDSLTIFRFVNRYFEATAPWKLAKGADADKERLQVVLWHAAEALRIGFTLLHPVMPGKMTEALNALGFTPEASPLEWRESGAFSLKPMSPLFPRIETKPVAAAPAKEVEDPFSSVELRAVKILSVEEHPNAEALYVLKVDAGEAEPRTVCAGLRKHLSKEELTGKHGVLVANLKPAMLRGVASMGMMLAADGEGKLSLANPEGAKPGDAVTAEGLESKPKPQITIKDFEKCPLTVRNGQVCYKDKPLRTPHGPVLAHAPDGAEVR